MYKIGNVDDPGATCVRIVHISDTHMRHDRYMSSIPDGDILVHTGDFTQWSLRRHFANKGRDRDEAVEEINNFFQCLPHKHKIFVPGNHEIGFSSKDRNYLETNLTSVTYLQDKKATLEGINFYGTPWTAKRWYSLARAFTKPGHQLKRYWKLIPDDTEVLITHMPPLGVCDNASKKFSSFKNLFSAADGLCNTCGDTHTQFEHWGCGYLKHVVQKVR